MELAALPALADNYIWMLHDGRCALVVDPGEAAPVLQALDTLRLELAGILVTHHHADHIAGIADLLPRLRGPVVAPALSAIPQASVPAREGDSIDLLGLRFDVMHIPGHTLDHMAYLAQPAGSAPVLFCGDTLFSGGCGRLFEGTPAQMKHSLDRLAALPGHTRVCCTHEYTLGNLRFGLAVEPGNALTAQHQARCQALRDAGQPTLPTTVALELEINPFLRCGQAEVQAAARAHGADSDDPLVVFTALRRWKDHFR